MAAMVLDYASVTGAVRVHSSPSVVLELLFAGMMLQFRAAHSPPAAGELLLAAERMVTVRRSRWTMS
jgi:hypothetical protein